LLKLGNRSATGSRVGRVGNLRRTFREPLFFLYFDTFPRRVAEDTVEAAVPAGDALTP